MCRQRSEIDIADFVRFAGELFDVGQGGVFFFAVAGIAAALERLPIRSRQPNPTRGGKDRKSVG